jgi:single-stranded-DNA-specific exonuclease
LREALAQVAEWPEAKQRRRGYVLAGEDWHRGVIGIVASRLVERYHRPVVLIAGGDEAWKGSGRSVGWFDLHEALSACSDHLLRWGGHRAAAGLSIDPTDVDVFARAFAEHADAMLSDEELAPVTPVDAIVPRGVPLTLELAHELARLAPFGLGNPGVTLLAPGCEVRDLGTVGDGKHLKFRVRGEGGRDAGSAIAFGQGSQLDRLRRVGRFDVVFRLEENHWNGTVAPQLVVRRVFDADDRYGELAGWLRAQWDSAERDSVAQEIFDELALGSGTKRNLLESERFRALLSEPAALPAAA